MILDPVQLGININHHPYKWCNVCQSRWGSNLYQFITASVCQHILIENGMFNNFLCDFSLRDWWVLLLESLFKKRLFLTNALCYSSSPIMVISTNQHNDLSNFEAQVSFPCIRSHCCTHKLFSSEDEKWSKSPSMTHAIHWWAVSIINVSAQISFLWTLCCTDTMEWLTSWIAHHVTNLPELSIGLDVESSSSHFLFSKVTTWTLIYACKCKF